ncbi:tyrosine-type recombinase/integrase [Sporomusa sphaeroides]|uniref:Transposase from transposon Tn916 n=1 Tax=Sporomusa sphaeroides DSM 2875 TaxID=1337886 RepID=A0ABM9W0U0_9FIRM|nr:site-specific integrase [Sporomusa sphaeroides]OLS56826.1 transposase from transposon Tn916 [Sporomusa sphaeroides DSM 2875]CVK18773.1 Transposase from transposon Tn916 [Sporomusa sphaeroides DSM 2875]
MAKERRENGAGTKPKQLANGKWWKKISYTDNYGNKGRKNIYGNSEAECKANEKTFLKDIADGIKATTDIKTLGQWLTKWLVVYKKPPISEITTYAAYEHQINQHIIPELGNTQLKKLQRVHIQEFFNKKGEKLSPSTLKLIKAVLNDALNMAMVDGYITKNPLVKIALPAAAAKKIKPLVKDEIVKLLKAAEGSPFYTIIYLAIHTGARKGELAALKWDNVDFKSKRIHIQHSVKHDRANRKYIIGSTKTDCSRFIPIHDTVIAELKRHKAKQAAAQLELGDVYEKNNLVFAKPAGEILSLTVLASKFNDIVKESGIERRTFHDLRHTFASICISRKENIKALAEYLGHSDVGITYNTYGHLMPGDKENIANAITAYLAGE